MEPLLAALSEDLGEGAISTDPADLSTYGRDWTRVIEPAPMAIVFPRSTEEVAAIVRRAREAGVAIVPSGGRTGLAGGAVAARGELVLSLERMRRMEVVDRVGGTLRVQAGAVTAAVHEHCAPSGLTWPVDFASKGSSQVGGNIATNAGGVKVIRYGTTRRWVLGMQVVTGTGEIMELAGPLEKNNTGLALEQLFVASEGTLGVITEATLKLTPIPGHLDVLLLAVPDLQGVLRLFEAARIGSAGEPPPFVISAFEFFTDKCHARLMRHRDLPIPLDTKASHYVLLEVEAPDDAALQRWLEGIVERDLVLDGTLARSAEQAARLWQLREGISESLSATGLPHKNDISLPIARLHEFCTRLDALFRERWPGFEVCLFGHIGDGNLHVNVMKPDAMDKATFLAHAAEADQAMFELVRSHGGSVSAEHGIGLLKKKWLSYTRSALEIDAMRAIKRAFDPDGIMNPGKVF